MAFVTIVAGRTDADSPVDQSLMDDIVNNLDDLDAARVTNGNAHNHEGGDGAIIGSGGISDILGSRVSKTITTIHQATTDGFLNIHGYIISGASVASVKVYSDSSASPTTLVAAEVTPTTNWRESISICIPIKKDDYYQVVAVWSSGSTTIDFISIGS